MASGNADCDTELCLTPGGRSSIMHKSGDGRQEMPISGVSGGYDGRDEVRRKISVFYGGQVCISDVTETQARAIICTAKKEMDEVMKNNVNSTSSYCGSWPDPNLLNSKLSMKRSLQSFLQQRKSRACEKCLHSDSSSNSS